MSAVAKAKRPDRQFPRYKVPLKARIDGETVTVCDWSAAGLGLADLPAPLQVPGTLTVTVLLETNGSVLELPLATRVVWCNPDEGRAGLEILDDAHKTAPLSDFADLYLAGRVVQQDTNIYVMGNTMSETESIKSPVVASAPSSGQSGLAGRIFGLAIFAVVGIAAFLFLFDVVYKRLFTFEAISASVSSDVVTVYQPRDGVVEVADLPREVTPGQKLATVTLDAPDLDGNRVVDIISPCDCYVLQQARPQGSYFGRAGAQVFNLVPKDAQPHVTLRVPFRRLETLSKNPAISLTYLDGTKVDGVEILAVPKISEYTATQLEVVVDAGTRLDPSMIGQPVYAVFDMAPWR
ncbi:PilZ domain-containing protein [Roseibium sp. Sym1]|uniref:PilZ domain-containing protein n=1 Tax=Roseibium sp. Sym1 TaxID=3016006 RepID=UPI0022B3FB7B|nr:PilZ domain-containing protein [Roseibium sp. Sym1]